MKPSKTRDILEHLIKEGSITSWEAYELYDLTRLSSVIFALRQKYAIDTYMMTKKNKYGDTINYAKYVYKGELNEA